MQRDIVIVGAGIAGLTAAIAFLKNGHKVRVFEQASEFLTLGAGIQISANAGIVLQSLLPSNELEKIVYKPENWMTRVFNTGEILHTRPLGQSYTQKYGVPYYLILREQLHQLLLNTVRTYEHSSISLNSKVIKFESFDNSILIQFDNGNTTESELVVGADGIHSTLRKQIVNKEEVEYSGYAAWRILIDANKTPSKLLQNENTTWVGPGKHAVTYRLDGGKLQSFVAAVKRSEWKKESWTEQYPWQELQDDFQGWNDEIQAILEACKSHKCYRWALLSRKPIKTWSSGRAILIGDAAHPTLPFLAQGAAMGIESAALLARYLEMDSDLEKLLEAFQHFRMPRTSLVTQQSELMANINHKSEIDSLRESHTNNPLLDNRDWIYAYDSLNTQLQSPNY